MAKYVALLRGINVGGSKTVSMIALKKAFESLGYTNVSTYINSGNVIFETAVKDPNVSADQIEHALHKQFGFQMRVLVRSRENIQKVCKGIPADWKNNIYQKTDILFLWDEFDNRKTIDAIATNDSVDELKYIAGAIAWHVRKKDYTKSGMRKFIGTQVYKHMTARNVNTVRKLAELMH